MADATDADSQRGVRPDLREVRARTWRHIAGPGTWWTGAERVAIAAEARAARGCALCAERRAALSPGAVTGAHTPARAGVLAPGVVDVIHRIVTDPGRLTQRWLRGVLASELDDARYVELVAVAVFTHGLDVFRRALGDEVEPLPAPEPGEPARVRPPLARDDGAWVPLVPDGAEGGAFARALYGGCESVPNIGRALSLVPAEVSMLFELAAPHYMELPYVPDPHYEAPGRTLDRVQTELVAARVSSLNVCFY